MTRKNPDSPKERRKPPRLPNGQEEFFLPAWLVTGSYSPMRVDEQPRPAQEPKK